MPGEYPYLFEPGANDRLSVKEMLGNSDSEYWKQCHEHVKRMVHLKAKNILWERQEDIIQEVMCKIAKSLPGFRFRCSLKTWVYTIIENCIADDYRHIQREERFHVYLVDTFTEDDHEVEELKRIAAKSLSIEENFEINEKLRAWKAALLDYVNIHAHPIRNLEIVKMVILEGHTQIEAARVLGCDIGVVSYVVREAKSYARKMMYKP